MLRVSELALGELEQEVLELLWAEDALNPVQVHDRIGKARGISINTVSSALKRLYEKELLSRHKVSHAYVYRARIERAELQRQLIESLANQFGEGSPVNFLAAFVDLAEARGEETLRQLEQMIAARLGEGEEGA